MRLSARLCRCLRLGTVVENTEDEVEADADADVDAVAEPAAADGAGVADLFLDCPGGLNGVNTDGMASMFSATVAATSFDPASILMTG